MTIPGRVPVANSVAPSSVVKAEGVNKFFGSLHVLKDINLEVQKNETVVIIGPSGSGKSTFLRCINHLEKINSGHIYVNGHLIGIWIATTSSLRTARTTSLASGPKSEWCSSASTCFRI